MGRKAKFSKEIKIQACKDYEEGKLSIKDISKKLRLMEKLFDDSI